MRFCNFVNPIPLFKIIPMVKRVTVLFVSSKGAINIVTQMMVLYFIVMQHHLLLLIFKFLFVLYSRVIFSWILKFLYKYFPQFSIPMHYFSVHFVFLIFIIYFRNWNNNKIYYFISISFMNSGAIKRILLLYYLTTYWLHY